MNVEVSPSAASQKTYTVQRLDNPTAQQKRLGDAWLAKMAFKP
jgi:hypothetical protein